MWTIAAPAAAASRQDCAICSGVIGRSTAARAKAGDGQVVLVSGEPGIQQADLLVSAYQRHPGSVRGVTPCARVRTRIRGKNLGAASNEPTQDITSRRLPSSFVRSTSR